MRIRTWIFAALVALAFAINLALVSLRIAQTGEDTVRSRMALASSALKAQLELLDARLSPRAVATVPDLIEATRAPADPTLEFVRPDERALRAAASALTPEPDLVAVVNARGAILSRRGRPAQQLDDPAQVPLGKAAQEGNPPPAFVFWDGSLWRIASMRIPGNAAAVAVGMMVGDRFAAQLKSQVDADVTLLAAGKVVASSLSPEERGRVARWAAAPSPGYGVLQVILPGIGNALSGKLPRGASRYAVRGTLVSLDSGVQAALTVPASPYLGWLARYQAFYLLGLILFILFSFFWGLSARSPGAQRIEPAPRPRPPEPSLDVGQPRSVPPEEAPKEVPWTPPAEEPAAPPPAVESLDPDIPAPARPDLPHTPTPTSGEHPMWSADPFMPTPASEEAKGDSAFGGLLDEAARSRQDQTLEEPRPPLAQDYADKTVPGDPSPELLEATRDDTVRDLPPVAGEAPYPGDEPTRVEPVSAALLDKLRERDEGEPAPTPQPMDQTIQGWGSVVSGGEQATESQSDPDEDHWRETFEKFCEMKTQLGEATDRINFEKFAAKLRKNRDDLIARHSAKGVRFVVYEKEGKAAIKASAIR
jgi:hypothetical protein